MSTITTNTFQELATGNSVGAKYVVRGTAKFWLSLNMSASTLNAQFNWSSTVDNGVGDWTANLASAMATANYLCVGTPNASGAGGILNHVTKTASSVQVRARSDAGTLYDATSADMQIMGSLA
jgi:hypothetical protein